MCFLLFFFCWCSGKSFLFWVELCATVEAQSLADIEAQYPASQETQNLASLQMYRGGGEYVALWIFSKLVVVLYLMCGCAADFVPCVHYAGFVFVRHYSSLWKLVVFISGGGSTVETQDFASFFAPQEFLNGA